MQSYPCAERLPLVDQTHGHTVADPYRWLEDPGTPATRRWQAAQDELWLSYAATLPSRFRFRGRVRKLADVGSVSTPLWRGDRCFVLRREPGQEHPVLFADDKPLLDPHQLDPTGLTTLDSWQPSPDGGRVAVQLSRGGDEQASLLVLDTGTGETVDGPLDGCRYSPVAWLPDGNSFYYVRFRQVRRRELDTKSETTILADEASYGLELSADGRWLSISAAHGSGNDLWFADLSTADAPAPIQQDAEAITLLSVGPDDRLYVITTHDAPTGRIDVGDPSDPLHRRPYLPADPDAPLSSLTVLDDVVLVGRSRRGISEIAVHDRLTGKRLGEVPLPGAGSVGSLTTRGAGGYEAWFSYTDSVTPAAVFRYDARSGRTTPWSRPLGFSAEAESHRVGFSSADGTELSMLVVTKPGISGPRPTLLYGYGGFGQTITPAYSAFALAWVEAGGAFVTAAVRGGGERGAASHRDGTLLRKQNVFDDFIAAAEQLIAEGWTTPAQLGICGESNGGLLIGAALTQRPELFAAAVCSAPLLDMLRYELSGLGSRWVPEFGSAREPEHFANLLSYSPYHRVVEGVKYPAVLFTVFANDSRVDPLHARKMCAALQHATAGDGPVVLRLEEDAGHAGGGTSRGVGLAADMLAFLAQHTGLAQQTGPAQQTDPARQTGLARDTRSGT